MRQQACQCPKVPEPAPLGRVQRAGIQVTSATGRPPRRAGKSSKNCSFRHRLALGPGVQLGAAGLADAPFQPRPAPSQRLLPSCARGSARAAPEQHAAAPGGRGGGSACSQSPASPCPDSPSESVCSWSSLPISPSLHSPLELLSRGAGHSLIPPSPQLESVSSRRWRRRGEHPRRAPRFSGWSGCPAGWPSASPAAPRAPRIPSARPPERVRRLAAPPTSAPDPGLAGAGYSPGHSAPPTLTARGAPGAQ